MVIVASIIVATYIFTISQNSYAAPRNKRAVAVICKTQSNNGPQKRLRIAVVAE